jgi:hypothetical protein
MRAYEFIFESLKNRQYIRFGLWSDDERSQNHITGEMEEGVSVYETMWSDEYKRWDVFPSHQGEETLDSQMEHLVEYSNPIFLVKGDEIGEGQDGEPLLRNVVLIKKLTVYDIFASNLDHYPGGDFEEKFDNESDYVYEPPTAERLASILLGRAKGRDDPMDYLADEVNSYKQTRLPDATLSGVRSIIKQSYPEISF